MLALGQLADFGTAVVAVDRRVGELGFDLGELFGQFGDAGFELAGAARGRVLFVLAAHRLGRLGRRRGGGLGGLGLVAARAQPGGVFVQVAVEFFDVAVGDAPEGFADQADQVAVVRDQHDRAGEVGQRLGQRLAHVQVEVVGGFVEQQHVRFAVGDQGQGQARALAAGKAIDVFEGAVTDEVPAAQEVAQLLFAGVGRDFLQVPQRALAFVQALDGVLGEVADAHVGVRHAFAAQQRQFTDQGFHQGRLAGAVGAEQADAVAGLQAETDVVQDDRIGAISRLAVVDADDRMRQPRRLGEVDVEGAFGAHGFGAGQLGQALHAALGLLGLAGLGLEPVDETLQVRAFDLFLVVGDLLLAQVFGALAFEAGVVADVKFGPAFVQVQGVRAQAVEEFAVVRDHQQRARVLEQPLFKPQHGVEVEVVGGFVEQQQVRGHHQRPRQVQAHAPAAREIGDRLAVGFGRKAQAVQQATGAGGGVIAVDFGQALVRFGHGVPVLGFGGGRFGLQHRVHFGVAGQHVVDGRVGQRGGFLRHPGDARLAGQVDVALVGFDLAQDGGEQAGLAAAIAADNAHPPAGVQGQVDLR